MFREKNNVERHAKARWYDTLASLRYDKTFFFKNGFELYHEDLSKAEEHSGYLPHGTIQDILEVTYHAVTSWGRFCNATGRH